MAMSVREKTSNVVKAAQHLLRVQTDGSLLADGRWGSHTHSVYSKANRQTQDVVNSIFKAVGMTVEEVRAAVAAAKVSDPTWKEEAAKLRSNVAAAVPPGVDQVKAFIRATCAKEGVDLTTAMKIASLESKFDQSSVNAKSGAVGTYQILRKALADVNQFYGKKNGRIFTREDLFDLQTNVLVGVQYIAICARYMKTSTSNTAAVYMCFNIGVGNIQKFLAGTVDKSVTEAIMGQNRDYWAGGVKNYAKNVTKIVDSTKSV